MQFSHLSFEDGETYRVEASKSNYIIFITKGMTQIVAPSSLGLEKSGYNSGDVAFFPVSFDFDMFFTISGDLLVVAFDSSLDVYKELQRLLTVEGGHPVYESKDYLCIKYPLNIYVMLVQRYIQDDVMSHALSLSKLDELFFIFKHYYDQTEIQKLFLPIVSSVPSFKVLVYSKMKTGYNVDDLASACQMGKRTFVRKFKDAFDDMPPHQWIQMEKRKKVLQFMSRSGVTISDVIQKFNFYDASHFTKFCKKYYQKTPGELFN